ncbi:zinc transporter ZupT [Proteiniclasticum sp. QWL-01]|jgi:ZIP family zinc transporter|uniref:zinc transporter ZupT n=1 Tax=Proteiniclasticum sp. QWL-01 TaxID=3036945 RepID=UPI0022083886|nr:zinc transporter ZupT [Proteiniclasticum sp. QWL-01]UUM11409.1 zinc transporter ZupT [Clostridiaceae bacterium HFYG-1003]WFF72812.1 zinc transporter ZupT [Proteiniclasticum sp. QWL-01]
MEKNILLAFLLTSLAGLATGFGSLIALLSRKTNTKFLSLSLGFSAGVMVYVSFMEIFPKALDSLSHGRSPKTATTLTVIGFFVGIALIAVIDQLIPEEENPHEIKDPASFMEHHESQRHSKSSLMRTGVFTALAIGIHNFPEGLATFITALDNPTLAIPIVVAIAIHNIPEGISVSVPIYFATGSRRKAFLYSFLSGLAEPLGALVGYLILMPFLNDTVEGFVFAAVAGIMVFISIDELLPTAEEYGQHHLSILGFVLGMMLMALSLILFL